MQIPVQLPVIPCPQRFETRKVNLPDGAPGVLLLFQSPMCVFSALLDATAAETLARQLDEARVGLTLAKPGDMPPPGANGDTR